jgi:hypothetical protein
MKTSFFRAGRMPDLEDKMKEKGFISSETN